MSKGFYNTIKANGQLLIKLDKRAVSLEDKVLDQFFLKQRTDYTPFEMWCELKEKGFRGPCSSVRRAMTNLTEAKSLEKLDGSDERPNIMRPGEYDTPNHAWRLVK